MKYEGSFARIGSGQTEGKLNQEPTSQSYLSFVSLAFSLIIIIIIIIIIIVVIITIIIIVIIVVIIVIIRDGSQRQVDRLRPAESVHH
eukprot:COSAG06_NODE_8253_length_2223_cov_1.679379_1_plen_88_part_00